MSGSTGIQVPPATFAEERWTQNSNSGAAICRHALAGRRPAPWPSALGDEIGRNEHGLRRVEPRHDIEVIQALIDLARLPTGEATLPGDADAGRHGHRLDCEKSARCVRPLFICLYLLLGRCKFGPSFPLPPATQLQISRKPRVQKGREMNLKGHLL
jgi:hypothetical protein